MPKTCKIAFERAEKVILAFLLIAGLLIPVIPASVAYALNDIARYTLVVKESVVTPPVTENVARVSFNEDWRFLLATRTPADAAGGFAANGFADPAGQPAASEIINPAFNDSAWRTVKIPHDFAIEGQKLSSGSGSQNYLQGGLGWYRKTFVVPEALKDSRVQLDFEGVYQNSNVYVNGQMVGNYPSGYTGFTYDITDYLTYGGDNPNVVVVKVQNKSPSGRWYTGSGITRPVTMVITGQTRFLRNGVVITAPALEADYKSGGSAEVRVKAEIRSDDVNSNIWLVNKVYDAGGSLKTQHASEPQPMNPSSFITLNDAFNVDNIKLWTLEDPYRYRMVTELYYLRDGSEDPVLVDSVTNKIGFRWFRIDNSDGAFLNGVYFKFQGVDLHHDDGALGAAGTYDAIKRKMSILKTMGVNAYRTSHNPPNKTIIDICSEMGIVVIEEAYDGWGGAKAANDFGLFFWQNIPDAWKGSLKAIPANTTWSEWVIKEMAGRDINEPSVVMWSIGNEIGGMGTRPSWYNWADFRREGDPNPGNYTEATINEFTEAMRLRNYIKDIDPTRYVVMGDHSERTPPSAESTWGYVNAALDGYGLNYNTASSVDALHNAFKNTFFFESESSSQTGVRGVYFDAPMQNTPANQTPGTRGVSSYDNNFSSWTMPNEYGLKKDRDRKFFLGQFIWSGFDYLGEPTPYGAFPMGVSNFGCIDTAGFPKDSYYLYRSQWLKNEHTTHIVPMNWTDWALNENVEVWVYTDGIEAELFLNDVSLGVKKFDEKETAYGLKYYETTERTRDNGGSGYGLANERSDANPNGYVSPNGSYGKLHLTWDVPFQPGELKTVARDKQGNVIGTDVVKTAGHAFTTRVTPDKAVVKADGDSLVYFSVDVVDENGTMLPSAMNLLEFSVTGGKIIGVDSGYPGSTDLYKWGNVDRNTVSQIHAWNGKALVIVETSKNPGPITLRTTSENMITTTCTVLSTADGNGTYNTAVVRETPGSAVGARLYNGNALTVPAGSSVKLPVDAEVTYAGGAKLLKKVVWPAIETSKFAQAGAFEVVGSVADTGLTVTAAVTVTAAARTNIALNTTAGTQDFILTDTSGPLATATFTSGSNYPNNMLNGNTTSNWNNRASGASTVVLREAAYSKPHEFVQVYWKGYKAIGEVDLYFTLGSSGPSNNLPASMNVQYWNGFAWVDAANQKTEFATVSNQASKVTFDPVLTGKVRVGLKNATPYSAVTGAFTIVKFEVYNIADAAPVLPPAVTATYSDSSTLPDRREPFEKN